MSRISARRTPRLRRGFTLMEVMIAMSITAIVVTAIFAAYLYIGRNLTRLMNLQEQEMEARRTLRNFTGDLSAAIELTTATTSALGLTKPATSGNTTVSYAYSSVAGTLTRTDSTGTKTMLTGLSSFSFTYYNEIGTAITASRQSVKAVEFVAVASAGSAGAGTLARYTTASPRVVLRNKQILQ